MIKTKHIVLFLAIFLCIGILAISNNTTGKFSQDIPSIKIGVITVLSGDAAIYGEAIKEGLDLGLEEINQEKIELIYEDTQLDSEKAIKAINKLIYIDKVDFIISGEGSSATSAVVGLLEKEKIPTILAIASAPELKESGDYIFRVVPSDDYQGKEIASFVEKNNWTNTAILYVNDNYGQGIKETFEENYTGKIVFTEGFKNNETDFTTQITKIKEKNPDIALIIARTEYSDIFKQAKELGLETNFVGSETLYALENKEKINAYCVFYKEQYTKEFEEKFEEKYKKEPTLFSNYGYDAIKTFEAALQKTNTKNREIIKNTLYNLEFNGATGTVFFDKKGEIEGKNFIFYKIENNNLIPIE